MSQPGPMYPIAELSIAENATISAENFAVPADRAAPALFGTGAKMNA